MTMIWGMTLEPGKLYTETMGEEVQLSMAAIDSRKDPGESSSFCQIVIQTDKGEYVLCTLVHGVMFQQSLDLKLMPREKVTFSVQGPSVVYLVGYTASYPEDEELTQDIEGDGDYPSWEAIEDRNQSIDRIKQEPVGEILDDSDTKIDTDDKEVQSGMVSSQEPTEAAAAEELLKDSEEEMIFSVAEIEPPPVVKTEAIDPPVTSEDMTLSELPPEGELCGIQPADHGVNLPPQTSTSQDSFYPKTQEQSDVGLTPPVIFQPVNAGPDFHQLYPQGGIIPAAEVQRMFLQKSQPGALRQPSSTGNGQLMNIQRNYPLPRRQYGTNRNQPVDKSRSAPQPMNIQEMRNLSSVQSTPGPSQQDNPGPSIRSDLLNTGDHLRIGKNNQESTLFQAVCGPDSGKAFDDQIASSKALILCSSGSGYRKYTCKYCFKLFSNTGDLVRHERTHTGEKPFQCGTCSKAFRQMSTLKDHENTHTGYRPFRCSYCGRGFKRKGALKTHENIHSSEK